MTWEQPQTHMLSHMTSLMWFFTTSDQLSYFLPYFFTHLPGTHSLTHLNLLSLKNRTKLRKTPVRHLIQRYTHISIVPRQQRSAVNGAVDEPHEPSLESHDCDGDGDENWYNDWVGEFHLFCSDNQCGREWKKSSPGA